MWVHDTTCPPRNLLDWIVYMKSILPSHPIIAKHIPVNVYIFSFC